MRKVLVFGVIILFLLVGIYPSLAIDTTTVTNIPKNIGGDIISITVYEAWDLLTNTSNGIQIPVDIRTDEEWSEGFIDTPYPEHPVHYSFERLKNETDFAKFMELYEGKEIIIYNKNDGYRIFILFSMLIENNYTGIIYHMVGGINAWIDAGLPIRNNTPPDAPTIEGPSNGRVGIEYDYHFNAVDPDGDNVSYLIDWGDGTSDGWTNYYESGQDFTITHTWYKIDYFNIRCKAKDIYNTEGNWTHLIIYISRNKAVQNTLFLRFLERFPLLNRFLLLLVN